MHHLLPKEHTFFIRVNHSSSSFFTSDLDLVKRVKPSAVIVPKVSTQKCVADASDYLSEHKEIQIFALIESALGFMNLNQICSTANQYNLTGLVFGHEDYLNDIDAFSTDEMFNLSHARQASFVQLRPINFLPLIVHT